MNTDVETLIPDGEFIYSRTDLKGVIQEVNDAFARISGYSREEMIGRPHNLVRHPDMPKEAFSDFWRDLKAGRPWRGIVKNRRKDGGYYWVEANVSPVRENGRIVGYQSVRSKPTRQQVSEAEQAYHRIRSGDTTLRIESGRIVPQRTRWLRMVARYDMQIRVFSLMAIVPLACLLFAAFTGEPGMLGQPLLLALAGGSIAGLLYLVCIATPRTNQDLTAFGNWLEKLLASGDLSQRFDIHRLGRIGVLGRDADKLVSSLRATLQGMVDVAHQVDQATQAVDYEIHRVQHTAEAQHATTDSAAQAIERILADIEQIVEHSRTTNLTAQDAGAAAAEGLEVTRRASATAASLADIVTNAAQKVEQLGDRSQEIRQIASIIREIADQTNLLALNAAIEAARAGEQGRGFAVVADEVRKLAERTGAATNDISELIAGIHNETQLAVHSMRQGAEQVRHSVHLASTTEAALMRINAEMTATIAEVGDITEAAQVQQQALTELAASVESLAQQAEQNTASMLQTRASVEALRKAEIRMLQAVQQYQL
jgi:aerotaxis receptor